MAGQISHGRTEAERLAGGRAERFTDSVTGTIRRITLVTDNGGAFKVGRFAASRSELSASTPAAQGQARMVSGVVIVT
ncbi:hypothetical protein [Allokutzneria albata]|uniref:hypothetical protein n=1 Tax=Allokutzneria albata TaxID=211114 RepID=UPI0012DCFAA8|nr:hypothetical protein [Allokutzneria albata]